MASIVLKYDIDLFELARRVVVPVGAMNAQTAMIAAQMIKGNTSGTAVLTIKASGSPDGSDAETVQTSLIAGGVTTLNVPGSAQRIVCDSFACLVLELTTTSSAAAFREEIAQVSVTLRGADLAMPGESAGGGAGGGGGGGEFGSELLVFKP